MQSQLRYRVVGKDSGAFGQQLDSFTFTFIHLAFIHLADAFIQSGLQLLYMSEVARLWSN